MSKVSSDSFVHEIELGTPPQEKKELNIRLEASRHLRNACLEESLRKVSLIRQSRYWKKARTPVKSKEHTKERKELFQQVKKLYAYSEYDLHSFVAKLRKSCWIGKHLDIL